MIQATATMHDGRILILLGLSAENLDRLRQDRPISVDPAVLLRVKPSDTIGGIVLFYGETEGAMTKMLEEGGLLGAHTPVHAVPKGSTTPT